VKDTKERPSTKPSGAVATTTETLAAELGPTIAHHLFSAIKTLQVHDAHNRAAVRTIRDLVAVLKELQDVDGLVKIHTSIDFLFVNDARLAMDSQKNGPLFFLIQEMTKREVEGIEIRSGIDQEELVKFLRLFFVELPEGTAFDEVEVAFSSYSITNVKVAKLVERERRLENETRIKDDDSVRRASNQVFFRTIALVGDIRKGIEKQRAIQVQKVERLTQQMVDIIQADETILVGLSSIKTFDERTFAHSVNVCILSMLIGDRLGLSKSDVARLGVAALLHDIGKTYIPQEIINTPGALNDKEWELMRYHTFFGVKELSRINALREVEDGLFVALQHHVHFDNNGYPQRADGWDLRLFSRIVTVADYYDAMTTPRVYQEPVSVVYALHFILTKSGQIFDPLVAKAFIGALGIFPIGTVVELDTGELGVVVRQHESVRHLRRPFVALAGENGIDVDAPPIDLTERGEDGYLRSIHRDLNGEKANQIRSAYFVEGL